MHAEHNYIYNKLYNRSIMCLLITLPIGHTNLITWSDNFLRFLKVAVRAAVRFNSISTLVLRWNLNCKYSSISSPNDMMVTRKRTNKRLLTANRLSNTTGTGCDHTLPATASQPSDHVTRNKTMATHRKSKKNLKNKKHQ